MNIEKINKLDEITNIIENDQDLKKMKELSNKIEKNKILMDKINEVKKMDQFDPNYVKLKSEIIGNEEFKKYKELEKDLYYIVLKINEKLNSLTKKSE